MSVNEASVTIFHENRGTVHLANLCTGPAMTVHIGVRNLTQIIFVYTILKIKKTTVTLGVAYDGGNRFATGNRTE